MSLESVNKIKSLQQGVETVTGESYGDLTTAVQALKDGYGSSGGGTGGGIIEVTKLPTEDIDENAVYKVLNDGRIVYLRLSNGNYATLEEVLLTSLTKEVEFHFVDELPDVMLESNFDIVHAYVVSTGVVYANIAGTGVLSCFEIMGSTNRGYTDDISLETEEGVYVQRGEPTIDWYIRENGEWKMISPDTQTREVTYTESGEYEITPDDGKVISKATVKVEVPERYDEGYGDGKVDGYAEGYTASQNARQEKTFVENGEYTPDDGYSGFSKVTVNVTNVDTIDGWHVDVRSGSSEPPSGTVNTITFGYGG